MPSIGSITQTPVAAAVVGAAAFLAEQVVVRKARRQSAADHVLDRAIGDAHHVLLALELDLELIRAGRK